MMSDVVSLLHEKFPTYTEQELRLLPRPTYLLEGWVPEGGLTFVHGVPNSGKSLLLIDWTQNVARGSEWHGRPSRERGVLYLSSEGTGSFTSRLEAWRREYGVADLASNVRYVMDGLVLAGPSDQTTHVQDQLFVREALDHNNLDVLVVDPLANYIQGSLNDGAVANTFLNWVRKLMKEDGVTVLVSHHVAKSSGQLAGGLSLRGAGELAGAGDAVYRMDPTFRDGDEGGLEYVDLIPDKIKDGPWPSSMRFELASHEVTSGLVHLDGTPSTSVALRYKGRPSFAQKEDLVPRILLELETAPGLTQEALRERVGVNKASLIGTLRRLQDSGRVEDHGVGNKHSYFLGNKPTD